MLSTMNDLSPWSTPESMAPRISIVDISTPCSEQALGNFGTVFGFGRPPGLLEKLAFDLTPQRTRLRNFVLLIWFTTLTIAVIWWWLDSERQTILFHYKTSLPSGSPALDGLQFIDADHPFIRYVGRWTSTPDKSQKDGSFPGTILSPKLNTLTDVQGFTSTWRSMVVILFSCPFIIPTHQLQPQIPRPPWLFYQRVMLHTLSPSPYLLESMTMNILSCQMPHLL